MLRVLVQHLDDDTAHVIGKNVVIEERRDNVHVGVALRLVQLVVCDVLTDPFLWCSAKKQLKHNRTQSIDINYLPDLLRFLVSLEHQKLLNSIALFLNFAVVL